MTTITLEDLASKKAKPAEGLVISDHMLDLTKFTGSELRITGKGTKRLGFMNAHDVIISTPFEIDYPGTNNILKFDGTTNNIQVNGTGGKLANAPGQSISQAIYFVGVHSNIELFGYSINQRRDPATGMEGAACIQLAGVVKDGHSLGKVYIHDITGMNIGAEGFYGNHFSSMKDGKPVATGEELKIERVNFKRLGRDGIQQQGFKNVIIKKCTVREAGLQGKSDHCSALSMNDGPTTESILVEDSVFEHVPQLAFIGSGPTKSTFRNVEYNQGTYVGQPVNQAMYLKGIEHRIENCRITSHEAVRSLICADGSKVLWSIESTLQGGPKMGYAYNGGSFEEFPVVKEGTVPILTETTSTGTKVFAILDGNKIPLN